MIFICAPFFNLRTSKLNLWCPLILLTKDLLPVGTEYDTYEPYWSFIYVLRDSSNLYSPKPIPTESYTIENVSLWVCSVVALKSNSNGLPRSLKFSLRDPNK